MTSWIDRVSGTGCSISSFAYCATGLVPADAFGASHSSLDLGWLSFEVGWRVSAETNDS